MNQRQLTKKNINKAEQNHTLEQQKTLHHEVHENFEA